MTFNCMMGVVNRSVFTAWLFSKKIWNYLSYGVCILGWFDTCQIFKLLCIALPIWQGTGYSSCFRTGPPQMEANAASENVMSEVLGFFACGWCSWCNGRDNSHLLREKVWRCGRQTWIILDALCDNWWISWIYFPLIKPTRWAWSVVLVCGTHYYLVYFYTFGKMAAVTRFL